MAEDRINRLRLVLDEICPVCGREFGVKDGEAYVYKERKKDSSNYRYFCSWHCYRAWQNNTGTADRKRYERKPQGIGPRIKEMIKAGFSQNEICAELGCARSSVRYWLTRM